MTIHITPREMLNALRFGYHVADEKKMLPYSLRERDISYEDASQNLKEMVCSVIGRQRAPLAVLVSGGVDSTFVYEMAKECFPATEITTVGMGCPNSHYCYWPTRDWVDETLNRMNENTYRDLFFSSSLIATQEMFGRAAEHGETILTGDCGDELFCGYDKYLFPDVSLASLFGRRGRKLLSWLAMGYEATMTTPLDLSLYKRGYPKDKKGRMVHDIKNELIYIEIPKVETAMRMSGTVGKVCSPFLDPEVFEFCTSLPLRHKYRRGVRKVLLRRMLAELGVKVPHRKQGFAFPEEWIGCELGWWLKTLDRLISEGIIEVVSGEGNDGEE